MTTTSFPVYKSGLALCLYAPEGMNMKDRIFLSCRIYLFIALISTTLVAAEEQPWKLGIHMSEPVFYRQGIDVGFPNSNFGISVGSQGFFDSQKSDSRLRRAVDYAVKWGGEIPIIQGSSSYVVNFDLGLQTYPKPNSRGLGQFPYYSLSQGLVSRFRKFDFSVEIVGRFNFFSHNAVVLFGDRRVENQNVFPRLGIDFRI